MDGLSVRNGDFTKKSRDFIDFIHTIWNLHRFMWKTWGFVRKTIYTWWDFNKHPPETMV